MTITLPPIVGYLDSSDNPLGLTIQVGDLDLFGHTLCKRVSEVVRSCDCGRLSISDKSEKQATYQIPSPAGYASWARVAPVLRVRPAWIGGRNREV